MRDGLILTRIGVACGIVAAFAVMSLMQSLLFRVKPFDPVTYVAISVGIFADLVHRCWLPSRRAAAVDPIDALRAE